MPAAVADVRRIAPEFATVSDGDVQGFLADALLELNPRLWGRRIDRGQALLAAHMLSVAHPELAQPAGPVQSETVGQVSVSYAVPQAGAQAGELAASRHGIEYQRLLGLLCAGPQVT